MFSSPVRCVRAARLVEFPAPEGEAHLDALNVGGLGCVDAVDGPGPFAVNPRTDLCGVELARWVGGAQQPAKAGDDPPARWARPRSRFPRPASRSTPAPAQPARPATAAASAWVRPGYRGPASSTPSNASSCVVGVATSEASGPAGAGDPNTASMELSSRRYGESAGRMIVVWRVSDFW